MAGTIYLSDKEIDEILLALDILASDLSEESVEKFTPMWDKLTSKLYKIASK